ncbi:MAG: hypothetical protein ACTHK0_13705 [Ginsengibacter sp.]
MKKYRNLLILFLLSGLMFSCKKHVVEYNSVNVTSDQAEFQLHYFVPLTAVTANNIYKVEINGQLFANNVSPLTTYNAIPSGAVGRFYATKKGQANIKLYKGENLEPVYDQNVDLKAGKQNIFVYDFTKPPIVFDNGYPYTPLVTAKTGSTAWVKFYNFLYEKEGVPTNLKLQYQAQYVIVDSTKQKSDWVNVGKPVAFGESTGWEPVHVNVSTTAITSGNDRVDYRVRLIDANGNDQGSLQVLNASNKFVDYSDWWTAYVGRRFHHILSGMRADKPNCAVRQFTAL